MIYHSNTIINNYKLRRPTPPMSHKQLTPALSIDYEKLIGKGSTGNVYLGTFSYTQSIQIPVAVKIIPLSEINNEVVGYLLQCQLEALKLTSNCYSKNTNKPTDKQGLQANKTAIVQLYDIIVIDQNCHIVMQLLEGGTLKEYITEKKKLPEEQATQILKQLVSAYKILKDNKIVHRDLKPQNIIFGKNHTDEQENIPKIIDFGYCQIESIKKPNMFYNVGSPRYMSPQAYMDSLYSEKSDIWALGIVFYEMITGTNFDKGKEIGDCFKQIKEKGIPIPSTLSMKTKKILQMMLMFDPKKRQNCEGLIKMLHQQNPETLKNSSVDAKGELDRRFQHIQKNGFIRHSLGPFAGSKNVISPPKNDLKNHSLIRQSSPQASQMNRLFFSGVYPKRKQVNPTFMTQKKPVFIANSRQKQKNGFQQKSVRIINSEKKQQISNNPFIRENAVLINRQNSKQNLNPRQLVPATSEKALHVGQQPHPDKVVRINNKIINTVENHMLGSQRLNNKEVMKYDVRIEKNTPNGGRQLMVNMPNNQNNNTPRMVTQERLQMITINSIPYKRNNEHEPKHIQQHQINNSKIAHQNKEIPTMNLGHSVHFHNQNLTPTGFQHPHGRPEVHFSLINPPVHN